ncbi:MAG: hypothetical protein M3355_07255 [Actinomycetota bacterium]|nr:hypothetical protein [Actinomycetota bacterium]
MAKLDKEIDLLYLEAPGGFTAERDALAKRLRADGDRAEVERVAKLKKPSKPAWLVNALALGKPGSIAELLDVTERLRKAVSGGDADSMRSAARDEGRLLERLVGEARDLATEAGEKPAPAALDRVRESLQAAQVDLEVRERLVAGRLEREERAASFGLDGLTLAAPPKLKGKGKAAPRKREDAAAKRRLETAREAVASAKRELAEADVEASAAVRRRKKARVKLERAEERLSALRSD